MLQIKLYRYEYNLSHHINVNEELDVFIYGPNVANLGARYEMHFGVPQRDQNVN